MSDEGSRQPIPDMSGSRHANSHHGDGPQAGRLFYRLLQRGQQYGDKGAEYYEQRHRDQQVRFVIQRAKQLGLQIVTPAPSNA